jgi:hypothetical protein
MADRMQHPLQDQQPETGYPEPPPVGDETATLLGSLERQRATLAWKCADLDQTGLQLSIGGSTITLGGLLKHLAYMEDINFSRDLAGRPVGEPWCSVDWRSEPDWEWTSARDDQPAQLYRLWSEAVARSRSAVDGALHRGGLDVVCQTPSGKSESLRRLLVDMIEEYSRHTGHADLIREAVDGRVGEDPPGRPYPYRVEQPQPR